MGADSVAPQGLIAGKYRLTRLIGKGGMGAVWEGIHETLGARVAVKFIDAEHASSHDLRQRFVNEAKAAARLRSKHVVQVHDQGITDDGRPYIVMEFLSGEPLDQRLDRLGKLSAQDTARILLQVCRGLNKAHEAGIVHRDLKPENIFLVWDDDDHTDLVKVVDFGIAKFTGPAGSGSSSTRTGAVLGTPNFMSPEQARGLRTIDHRSDLWSLGVIAYRSIVGCLPFEGEAVGDLLVKICTVDAPPPSSIDPSVPPGFDAWVARALQRDADDRFSSAAELADALSEVCGIEGRVAAPASGGRPPPEPAPARTAPSGSPREARRPLTGSSGDGNTTDAPLARTMSSTRRNRPLLVGAGLVAVASIAGAVGLGVLKGSNVSAEGSASSAPAATAPVASPAPSVPAKAAAPAPIVMPGIAPVPAAKGPEGSTATPTVAPEPPSSEPPAPRARPVASKAGRARPSKASSEPKATKSSADILGY